MKRLMIVLFFLFTGSVVMGKDTVKWQHPSGQMSAVVTDEPCSEKVLALWRGAGANEELLQQLRRVRALPVGEEPFEACVLPADEDGDYPIVDERGNSGWLNHNNFVPLDAPPLIPGGVKT